MAPINRIVAARVFWHQFSPGERKAIAAELDAAVTGMQEWSDQIALPTAGIDYWRQQFPLD